MVIENHLLMKYEDLIMLIYYIEKYFENMAI